jgi:hypothetical protein
VGTQIRGLRERRLSRQVSLLANPGPPRVHSPVQLLEASAGDLLANCPQRWVIFYMLSSFAPVSVQALRREARSVVSALARASAA